MQGYPCSLRKSLLGTVSGRVTLALGPNQPPPTIPMPANDPASPPAPSRSRSIDATVPPPQRPPGALTGASDTHSVRHRDARFHETSATSATGSARVRTAASNPARFGAAASSVAGRPGASGCRRSCTGGRCERPTARRAMRRERRTCSVILTNGSAAKRRHQRCCAASSVDFAFSNSSSVSEPCLWRFESRSSSSTEAEPCVPAVWRMYVAKASCEAVCCATLRS